jgi:predicted NBD/HSP70 family sugar kinase
MVENFLSKAKEDLPVYINHVREAFSRLKDGGGEEIILVDRLVLNEEDKVFRIRIPALDGCSQEAADFIRSYLNAEIYNILSAIGGKYITFYVDTKKEKLLAMLRDLDETFGIRQSRSERNGFGKCINVIDRMIAGTEEGTGSKDAGFHFVIRDLEERPGKYNEYITEKRKSDVFHEAIKGVGDRTLCGIDIGGTDIKAVLSINGVLEYIKEYDWFPAVYKTADEIMDPIVDLVRLLAVKASYDRLPEKSKNSPQWTGLREDLEKAMEKDAPEDLIRKTSLAAEKLLSGRLIKIDAIGMCFPDVVVRDRIVGGETYKTRGIRNNEAVDYEAEFAKFVGLNEKLRRYSAVVKNTNDGPMAAFTAAVEMAASGKDFDLGEGIFAHTLGTELGTGWVDEEGKIPEIPLEIYNFIIDLGSFVQKEYEPDDVRSINNFNTNLAGTLQKYASQSGAFRLAMKYFLKERPDLIAEMEQRGYIIHKETKAGKGVYIELEKKDMRKPFLEFLMALPEREYDDCIRDEDDPTRKIWMDIGEYLAVTWCETERILNPEVKSRILFGRLVKNRMCFDLMKKGAEKIKPGLILEAADETMSYSPLMKQLEQRPEYTVAQFAQAVGAVYYANAEL